MVVVQLADRCGRGGDPGRRDRLEEGGGDCLVETHTSERLAGLTGRVEVAGRGDPPGGG